MEIAITLTAAPHSKELLLDLAAKLQRDLNGELRFGWLSEGEAVDLILPAVDNPSSCPSPARGEGTPLQARATPSPKLHSLADAATLSCKLDKASLPGEGWGEGELLHLKRIVAATVANHPADWCLQAAAGRRKRMLIADMDSTIIGQECLDEMADLKGIKPEIAALTERAMRGELDFAAALRERIQLLGGMTEADLQRTLDERITINPGARTLVETMKAHGAHTVLVSGGFTFFTGAVAARAGFAANRGNVFLWENGRLSGAAEPILGREAKLAALKEEAAAHGLSPEDAIAVGDGANDLAMLGAAGLGVAYRAKPVVAAEADAQVRYTDLTALLYFQGYARDSFAV
jgi:phosphoserine phosphatase